MVKVESQWMTVPCPWVLFYSQYYFSLGQFSSKTLKGKQNRTETNLNRKQERKQPETSATYAHINLVRTFA